MSCAGFAGTFVVGDRCDNCGSLACFQADGTYCVPGNAGCPCVIVSPCVPDYAVNRGYYGYGIRCPSPPPSTPTPLLPSPIPSPAAFPSPPQPSPTIMQGSFEGYIVEPGLSTPGSIGEFSSLITSQPIADAWIFGGASSGVIHGYGGFDGMGNTFAEDGNLYGFIQSPTNDVISFMNTTINDLVPGLMYTVTFYYNGRSCPYNPGGCHIDANDLNIDVNGVLLFTTYPVLSANGWVQGAATFTQRAGSSSAKLSFYATNPGLLTYWNDMNSHSGFDRTVFIDNVKVMNIAI